MSQQPQERPVTSSCTGNQTAGINLVISTNISGLHFVPDEISVHSTGNGQLPRSCSTPSSRLPWFGSTATKEALSARQDHRYHHPRSPLLHNRRWRHCLCQAACQKRRARVSAKVIVRRGTTTSLCQKKPPYNDFFTQSLGMDSIPKVVTGESFSIPF